MSRFIDEFRKPGGVRLDAPGFVSAHNMAKWRAHTNNVVKVLQDRTIPVLLIDNVADYYYTASDQEHWDLRDDFPNLAPPYDVFWCEHKLPRVIHSREKGDSNVANLCPNGRAGFLIYAAEREDCQLEGAPENIKWIYWCEIFIDYGMHRDVVAQGSHGAVFFAVDAQGAIVDKPWMQTFAAPEHNEMMQRLMAWFNPVWLAVSFLHCKNVSVEEHAVPKPLAKRFRERHGYEPSGHKTLIIEPLKQILRKEGRSHEVGISKAMHICRGHFRDYRNGRGLFGRYKQLVWMPQLIRGGVKGENPEDVRREVEIRLNKDRK